MGAHDYDAQPAFAQQKTQAQENQWIGDRRAFNHTRRQSRDAKHDGHYAKRKDLVRHGESPVRTFQMIVLRMIRMETACHVS